MVSNVITAGGHRGILFGLMQRRFGSSTHTLDNSFCACPPHEFDPNLEIILKVQQCNQSTNKQRNREVLDNEGSILKCSETLDGRSLG